MKFNIGDRVRCILLPANWGKKYLNIEGTIKYIENSTYPYHVEFDSKVPGASSLNGHCDKGRGFPMQETEIEIIDENHEFLVEEFSKLIF
jgi:hypothetical protein